MLCFALALRLRRWGTHGRLVTEARRLDRHVLARRQGVRQETLAKLGGEGRECTGDAPTEKVHLRVNHAGDLRHRLGEILAHLVDGDPGAVIARGEGPEDGQGVGGMP